MAPKKDHAHRPKILQQVDPGGDFRTTPAQYCVPLKVARTAREAAPFLGAVEDAGRGGLRRPKAREGLIL